MQTGFTINNPIGECHERNYIEHRLTGSPDNERSRSSNKSRPPNPSEMGMLGEWPNQACAH
jgi:hypothetical protein